jgi:hypothetical protein
VVHFTRETVEELRATNATFREAVEAANAEHSEG